MAVTKSALQEEWEATLVMKKAHTAKAEGFVRTGHHEKRDPQDAGQGVFVRIEIFGETEALGALVEKTAGKPGFEMKEVLAGLLKKIGKKPDFEKIEVRDDFPKEIAMSAGHTAMKGVLAMTALE
ncbi:MAG: hypothetical protein AB1540_01425 [Bdellovibrionota bacterium]